MKLKQLCFVQWVIKHRLDDNEDCNVCEKSFTENHCGRCDTLKDLRELYKEIKEHETKLIKRYLCQQ